MNRDICRKLLCIKRGGFVVDSLFVVAPIMCGDNFIFKPAGCSKAMVLVIIHCLLFFLNSVCVWWGGGGGLVLVV